MKLKWDAVAAAMAALALAAPVLVAFDVSGPLRIVATLPLLALVPGLALMGLVSSVEFFNAMVMAVAVSLALDVVTSLTLLYLHVWSVLVALVVLAVVTLSATAVHPMITARRMA